MRTAALLALSVFALAAQDTPRTLTLRQALEMTEKLSPEVQLARLRVLEAQANTGAVKSAYQPQLTATINGAYQTINLQNIGLFIPGFSDRVGPFRTFNARPVLTQTVLDLSLLSSIRASRERERVLDFDARTVRDETLVAVLQLYLQIQQAESRIAAAQARLETARVVWRQAQDFEQAGTANKLDVARAEQQFHLEQASLTQARRDRDVLQTTLLRTIGLAPDQPVILIAPQLEAPQLEMPPPDSHRTGDAALQTALDQRPELRSLDSRLQVAALEKQRAERDRYPKLSFVGDYGVAGNGPERSLSTYAIGATLTIPLWTGRRIESEIAAARHRMEQARSERRAQELRIGAEVRQAQLEMAAAQETLRSAELSTRAARESLELARLRFAAGISTNIDTTQAQSTLAQAEDFEIRSRYDYFVARARLARAKGDVFGFFE
jgi:outer membrane protein TolC